MTSIHVGEKDETANLRDWSIKWNDEYRVLLLTCRFLARPDLTCPLDLCRIEPTEELGEAMLKRRGSGAVQHVARATIYGERYAVVHYPDGTRPYVHRRENVEFIPLTGTKRDQIFGYFTAVAAARRNRSSTAVQAVIADNVARQLAALPGGSDTALDAYCTGQNASRADAGITALIYPFGVNESQLVAVERAFSAQVSLIEGPPGTGKTQTILNILANILLRGETVCVLSNNNAAVENVFEKLKVAGLDHLVAKLGNRQNREVFFADLPSRPLPEPKADADADAEPSLDDLQLALGQLQQQLRDDNAAAQLRAEIDELAIERRYLKQWQRENDVQALASLDRYGLTPRQTTDLLAYLDQLGERGIRLKDRIELLFQFGVFRTTPFAPAARRSIFHALQLHFYDRSLQEKETALRSCEASLERGRFSTLLAFLTSGSMRYLKQQLQRRPVPTQGFDARSYRRHFDDFLLRFPIIGSSTHSIVNSLASGAVLDYAIIDEASQQDIVPGILALGCSKNLIVVGDSRQLAHIPARLGLRAPDDDRDCERYSLLDSCIRVFKDTLPRTLLKEHYRCHPKIIQFCNQQFYDNALVPMTRDRGEAPLRLIVTAKGNHARGNVNGRELESLRKVIGEEADEAGDAVWTDENGRGFIAPYRAQAVLSNDQLPEDFVTDTVHKFQGRECAEIVFSTVLDKKRYNLARLDFVDDPRLVNVAVSRAKERFTLVTGDGVFTANNRHVAALIRHIEYYAEDAQISRAPVVSSFDLLYREYDESLERLRARLRAKDSRYRSEQIMAQILREALADEAFRGMNFHMQVLLEKVAEAKALNLTRREAAFMRNRASCDFVVYLKTGKRPIGVIEVDGGSHDRPEQAARDTLKNGILEKCGISILRVRTVESGIEEKVGRFLADRVASSDHG